MVLRLLAICCLLLVSTLGCTRDLHGTQHLVSKEHVALFEIAPYQGVWEYRYGDSPRDAAGAFRFASPLIHDAGWQTTHNPYQPPGRGSEQFLWLRTNLEGPPLVDPALFLQSVNQSFQAFLDGQLIAEFGPMGGPRAHRFPGEPRMYLPLLPTAEVQRNRHQTGDYTGHVLALRIHSPHRYIGVFGDILIGARASLLADQVERGASAFVIGLLMMGIGLLALLLFALRYSESVYFYYGCFTLSTGLHFLGRSSLHEVLFHNPAVWGFVVVFSLPVVSSSMCAFIWKTMGRGPFGVMPRLASLYLLFLIVAAVLVGSGRENLWDVLLPLQLFMLLGIIGLVTTLLLAAWRGDISARILSFGFVFCSGCAVVDIFAAMGIIGGSPHIISHYGVVGLVVSLGAVLARRFVGIALMTDRAARLEKESVLQSQRLAEQSNLLTAAGRMAKGDLVSKISVPDGNELSPLASALDSMRQDLQQKLAQLEQSNLAIRGLNDELRRQIEQRSHRLMEAFAQGIGKVPDKPTQVVPGKKLGDHYQVLATIGSGAMGTVFEVERVTDHRKFAAKILTEARKKNSLLRFAREAQILCRLDHPNLISIVDIDVTKDGVVFLVMELVRGSVLKQWRERFGNLRFAVNVLRQMTAGLAIIHKSGIVHRDLKPANVLLSEGTDGALHVKLADFGISILSEQIPSTRKTMGTESVSDSSSLAPLDSAEISDNDEEYADYQIITEAEQSTPLELDATGAFSATMSVLTPSHALAVRYSEMAAEAEAEADTGALSLTPDAHLTATGVLVGTPMYMAPELANGSKHARPSADLFALGVIAYELLTGEMPFASPVVWAKKPKDVKVSVPFRDHQLALPESLVAMLDRCLHRDPLLRPSAETLHAALAALPPLL